MQPTRIARLPWTLLLVVTVCHSCKPSNDTHESDVLIVATTSLPLGAVGAPYSTTLQAAGGTSPYVWSLAAGALPPGLSLDAAGTLSGTPMTEGSYTFVLQVSDSSNPNGSAERPFVLAIQPASALLSVTTAYLPAGQVGVGYGSVLEAAGGTQPYSWRLSGGYLPPGITLSVDGTLSGTPTASGSFEGTFQVTDGSTPAQAATSDFTLWVDGTEGSVQISHFFSLPGAAVGSAYSVALSAWGGTLPYAWSMAAGALPPGLSLDAATGVISGTATTAGRYDFLVQVADSSSPAGISQRQFTIDVFTAPLSIVTVSLPSGVVGKPYAYTLAANGGDSPYAWSVSAGSLPPGLTLDSATGAVSGTPTAASTCTFTVQATDSSSPPMTAFYRYKVTIASASNALDITTTAFPDGVTSVWYSATLNALGGVAPYSWASSGALPPGLALEPETGILGGVPSVSGRYNFTIKVTDSSAPMKSFSAPFAIDVYEPLQLPYLWNFGVMNFGCIGLPYSWSVVPGGGDPPYSCAVVSGSLPTGLSLNDCSIAGTPTQAGFWGFSIRASDSANPKQTASAGYFIEIFTYCSCPDCPQ